MNRKEVCSNCRWWDRNMKDGAGLCRVRPPQHYEGVGSGWPTSYEQDWCGAHKLLDKYVLDRQKLRDEAMESKP